MKHNGHKLFTLVELLVLLCIVFMLFSLLLPALQKAKGKSNQMYCMSNMNQIGKGYYFYVDDYNGYLCRYDEWCMLLEPYLKQRWVGKSYVGPYKWGTGMDLYFCPSNCSGLSSESCSYLVSEIIVGGYYSASALMISQIKKPSSVFLQAESAAAASGYFWRSVYQDSHLFVGNDCRIGWVHGNGANVLFVDGHVSGISMNHITTSMYHDYQ